MQGYNTDLITNMYINIIHDATFQVHKDCPITGYVLIKTAKGMYGYGVYNSCTMQISEYNQIHE